MKIGFIGLGHMGAAMAANLLKAGHDVTVYNRTPAKARSLMEHGAQLAPNVPNACRGEVVITMLANDEAVESVVFGEQGVLQSLNKGAIHISMSTISVALSEKLTHAHAGAGQRFLAAPVFGRPDAAAAAKLFIVAGGDPATFETCRALLEAMGQKVFHAGNEPRAANLIKLSGNFLTSSIVEALGEAIALITKAGIDKRRYYEILTSTLFSGPVFENYGALIVEQKFKPAGFAAPLGEKDIRLTLAAAETLRTPMPLAGLVHDRFLRLLAHDGEDLDWSAIGQLAAADAGVK